MGQDKKINKKWGLSKPTKQYLTQLGVNEKFDLGMCGYKKVIKICSIPAKNPTSFFNRLEQCGQDGKLVPIPLSLRPQASAHANMLIINPKMKWVERYEPHGSETGARGYDNKKINASLETFFNAGNHLLPDKFVLLIYIYNHQH